MESRGGIATQQEFVRRMNAHDPKAIVSLCTDDHVFIDSLGAQTSGRERLEQGWTGYFSLFPNYGADLETTTAQNVAALACGFAPATHAASKKLWRIPAAWRAIVRGGQIAECQIALRAGLTNRFSQLSVRGIEKLLISENNASRKNRLERSTECT